MIGLPTETTFNIKLVHIFLDLHRSVLHTDLPAPYCVDCKSAAHQERQETTGYIYTLWFQIDKIGIY